MLADAKEYLRKLQLLKENPHHQEDADYVQKHIDIMEYLIDCAEEVECNISHEEELPVLGMSERLEDLKEKHRKCCLNRGISIFSIKDIEWFIKQATENVERTKQLTALNYLLQSIIPPKRMSEFVGKDVIDVATIILKEQYGFIKEENESQ